jgi:hypothetical protein
MTTTRSLERFQPHHLPLGNKNEASIDLIKTPLSFQTLLTPSTSLTLRPPMGSTLGTTKEEVPTKFLLILITSSFQIPSSSITFTFQPPFSPSLDLIIGPFNYIYISRASLATSPSDLKYFGLPNPLSWTFSKPGGPPSAPPLAHLCIASSSSSNLSSSISKSGTRNIWQHLAGQAQADQRNGKASTEYYKQW